MMAAESLPGLSRSRRVGEVLLALTLSGGLGVGLGLIGGLEVKYQLAFLIGGVFLGMMALIPERRLLCLLLWIVIQPLSIEKVFYVNEIYKDFLPQAIVINAGDALLVLLAGFMTLEALFTSRKVWHWPKLGTLFGLFVTWALVSAALHAVYLDTGYTGSSPWALLHYARTLLFIVIVHSSVRTRADLICVLVALALIIFGEAILVGVSYVTGEIYNFARLTGQTPIVRLQTFEDGEMVRGVGTLGHTNQQAAFHTFYTLPLVALFVVRNIWFRAIALAVIGVSAGAIVLTFSRSAWISFAVALMLVFFVALRRKEISPAAWLVGAAMTMVMAVGLGVMASPIYERLAHGDDGATDSRIRMIKLAVDLFESHPIIGVGPGEFAEASLFQYPVGFAENEWVPPGGKPMVPEVGRLEVVRLVQPHKETLTSPLPVHNKYLLTLSELGVVGLFIWLCIYFHLFKESRVCARARDPVLRYIGVAGMAVVVAQMTYMMLDLFDDDKSVQILFFVPVIVTAAARIVRESAAFATTSGSTPVIEE